MWYLHISVVDWYMSLSMFIYIFFKLYIDLQTIVIKCISTNEIKHVLRNEISQVLRFVPSDHSRNFVKLAVWLVFARLFPTQHSCGLLTHPARHMESSQNTHLSKCNTPNHFYLIFECTFFLLVSCQSSTDMWEVKTNNSFYSQTLNNNTPFIRKCHLTA